MRGLGVWAAVFAAGFAAAVLAVAAAARTAAVHHVKVSAGMKKSLASTFGHKHDRKHVTVGKTVAVASGNSFYALATIKNAAGQPEMFSGTRKSAKAAVHWRDLKASHGKPCSFPDGVVSALGYAAACGLTSGTTGTTTTIGAATTVVSGTSFPLNDLVLPVQWSQGGTHLVWLDGSYNIESVPAGGGTETTIANNNSTGGSPNSFAVSPNGSQIAYDHFVNSPCCREDVETIASDGAGSPVVTFGSPSPMSAGDGVAWSSDSADVYFSNYDSGNGESWIARVPAGGGSATEVTPAVGGPGTFDVEALLAVGANGNLLYAHETSSSNDDEVFLSGGGTFDTGSESAILSPDGSKVATDLYNALTVENADGSDAKTIASGRYASFSSDSSKLAYSDSQGTWVINADGTSLKQVSTTPCVSQIEWSPDDSTLVCAISSSSIGTMPTS